MKNDKKLLDEINVLKNRVKLLENSEALLNQSEEELQVLNEELNASNQQLTAHEQQLTALNQQLTALNNQLHENEISAKSAQEFAESIIRTVRSPLIVLNNDMNIISTNRSFNLMFKIKNNNIEGENFFKINNGQWNIPTIKDIITNLLSKKSIILDYEIELELEGIGNKLILLNASELRQKKGLERLILISLQDITEVKQKNDQLNILNKELEIKTEELRQLLYITTHDLRSPLVNIQGFSKELEQSLIELNDLFLTQNINPETKNSYNIIDDEIKESLHFIKSSTDKMDTLLNGLLVLSRIGRQVPVIQDVNMNKLMKDVADNYEYICSENEITVNISVLPVVKGDEDQLNQVFSNLLGNAIKFIHPDRKGIINISGIKEISGNTYIVEDNGVGIESKYFETIFGLFNKLSNDTPGVGLGLNIVKQIVNRHNGSITVESKPDEGTKFIIFLPS